MNVYRCSKHKSKSKSVVPISIVWGSGPGWVSAYLDMLYADVPFTCELRFSFSPASPWSQGAFPQWEVYL